MPSPTYVTTRRAAEMIGYPGRPVSQKLVRTWIRLGVLKAKKHIVSDVVHQQTHWLVSVSSIRYLKRERGK
jgi:hypothetical protein